MKERGQINRIIGRTVENIGLFGLMMADVLRWAFRRPFRLRLLLQQMEFVGNQSLSIILLTGFFTGAVFALQTILGLRMFNAQSMVGSMVALSLTRELAPVLCCLMVTGRCGSAMAAEIGTMRVTEQVDALTAMAVNPIHYLVVPRVLAAVLMMPVLVMVFNIIGISGSYLVAVLMEGIDKGIFMDNIRWFVDPMDIYIGLSKSMVFAFVMSMVGCFKGYYTLGGARGVGRSTTQAVVTASVMILVVDYFLTQLFMTLFEQKVWS